MPIAAVVGDVVGSRAWSPGDLFGALAGALRDVNDAVPARTPLQLTVGDEFQAVYETVAVAVGATWELAMRLRAAGDDIDARAGIGWGEVTSAAAVTGSTPFAGQGGPGWWNARSALELVEARARRGRPASSRTAVAGTAHDGLWNAHLLCRDELMARLDSRDARIVLATLAGTPQADIAADLGITQPAVSKRLQGLYCLIMAHEELAS